MNFLVLFYFPCTKCCCHIEVCTEQKKRFERNVYSKSSLVENIFFYVVVWMHPSQKAFLNWGSLHTRPNSDYNARSYKKKKGRRWRACRKVDYKEFKDKRSQLNLDLEPFRSKVKGKHSTVKTNFHRTKELEWMQPFQIYTYIHKYIRTKVIVVEKSETGCISTISQGWRKNSSSTQIYLIRRQGNGWLSGKCWWWVITELSVNLSMSWFNPLINTE